MTEDDRLDLEIAYTPWEWSCRAPAAVGIPDTPDGVDQVCRRERDHYGDHATGYGKDRKTWKKTT